MGDHKLGIRVSLDGWEPGTSLLDFLVTENPGFRLFYTSNSESYIEFEDIYCQRGHKKIGDNLYIKPGTGVKECRTCRKKAKAAR